MVDWSKLKPYQSDKRKSFEELCYQLAKKLYGELGRFTSIDDSGGGDGVEFFLTLANGTEWGWQAKFYYPQPRLNPSRKGSIQQSFRTSLKNHQDLTRWFLCTPTSFTKRGKNSELSWFRKTLKNTAPEVELDHWGDSELSTMLSEPKMAGKRHYFFGTLELSPEWFKSQVKKQLANVRDKYIPELHTETNVDSQVHYLLGDSTFVASLVAHKTDLREERQAFLKAIETIQSHRRQNEWKKDAAELYKLCNELCPAINDKISLISSAASSVADGQMGEVFTIDLSPGLESIKNFEEKYRQSYYTIREKKIKPDKGLAREGKEANDRAQAVLDKFYKPLEIVDRVKDDLHKAAKLINDLKRTDLQIFGEAGIGKTHLTCHTSDERVQGGLPAILLLGGQFTRHQTLEQRVHDICDIPASYSWGDFVSALDSYAEAHKTAILIAIDALNEAESIDIWKQELPGFIEGIKRSRRIKLVTTCRTSYREAIWGKQSPQNSIPLPSLHGHSLEETLSKYFAHYKLKVDLTSASLEQFSHPIYLRIFCESQNPKREQEREVYVGQQTIFAVFEQFLSRVNTTVCERLSRPPTTQIIKASLVKLAQALWKENDRYLNLDRAIQLIDGQTPTTIDWEKSLTKTLLDEGLIVSRAWASDSEKLAFTYDLFGGYLIVQGLFSQKKAKSICSFVKSRKFGQQLISKDYQKRHPLHEDILRCISALIPERTGLHLYRIRTDGEILSYAVRALFEMNPVYVKDREQQDLRQLFKVPSNRQPLFKLSQTTVLNVGHPLNINFWEKILFDLPMPERDESWTEHIRPIANELIDDLRRFERACRELNRPTNLEEARLHLTARYTMWLLTSTHRLLRDSATKALFWYGRLYSQQFFDLTLASLEINDPYVPERMLAASYGVAMATHSDPTYGTFTSKIFPGYARWLFKLMFEKGASYATTHALMRDFAKHSIDIALLHDTGFLTARERKRITPPYRDGGIRKWGKSKDRNEGEYRDGNAPLGMDFENYTLGRLSPNRENYDFKNRRYVGVRANIYWRLYDLGYTLERFGVIDKAIARDSQYRSSATNSSRIDRYGKKYSWIAYYELYGFLRDKRLLKGKWQNYDERPVDIDIDPSFPTKPREIQVVKTNFLGNRSLSPQRWVSQGGQPKIAPYLIMEEIDGELGPWVLIDGSIRQEEETKKRGIFIFSRGLMIGRRRLQKFLARLQKQNLGGRWLPEIPEDYYSFAGEVPWSDTFPLNEKEKVGFQVGVKRRKVRSDRISQTRLLSDILKRVKDLGYQELVEERLRLARVEAKKKSPLFEEVPIIEEYRILLPVRYNMWESYHSGVNPGQYSLVLAREVAEDLGLWIKLPSWDMYDSDGRRASISTGWEEPSRTNQTLLYLRKDLLDKFLKRRRISLVWGIWGERETLTRENNSLRQSKAKSVRYKVYQQIWQYGEHKPLLVRRTEWGKREKG